MKPSFDPRQWEVTDDISIDKIILTVDRLSCRTALDLACFKESQMRAIYDEMAQRMILELQAKVASKKYAVKTVRYPDGAWQFVKAHMSASKLNAFKIVRWFLKRYPVRFVEVTMEANAYHPDIAIPGHEAFVEIVTRAERNAVLRGERW